MMKYNRIFILISIAILSRLIPHPPNFTAMNAIAFLGSTYLLGRNGSLLVLFAGMFLSDCLIGFHNQIFAVYFCFGLTTLLGRRYILLAPFLFFGVTNFSEWILNPLYPKTLHGLELCYLAALPFLQNQILGDLFYGLTIYLLFQPRKICCENS